MQSQKQKQRKPKTPKDVGECIKQFFEESGPSHFSESGTARVHPPCGKANNVFLSSQFAPPVFVMKEGKVRGFRKGTGTLTIENEHLLDVSLGQLYFKHDSVQHNFLYQKEPGEFYPVKFVFQNNIIEDFDAQSLSHEERCVFKENDIAGTISGLNASLQTHERFLKENTMMEEISFSGCVFTNQDIKGKKIAKLIDTTATEKLSFEDCEIMETDFRFRKCPIVQFLEGTNIYKIVNVYKVNSSDFLSEDDGVRDIYFSEKSDAAIGHTPEEKQYFFRHIRLFQDKRGDQLQALFAYQKYLQQEIGLKRLRWYEKLIIRVSMWFGNGLSWVRPLCILLLSFSLLSAAVADIDPLLLFPMFPHLMFAEIEGMEMRFSFLDSLTVKHLVFSLYYPVLALSWYFIIKSLRKFTYRK